MSMPIIIKLSKDRESYAPTDYGRVAAIQHAPAAIGVGALGITGSSAAAKALNVTPDKGVMGNLKSLKNSVNLADPGDFVREYVDKGHTLMSSGLKYNKKRYNAEQVMEMLRSGKVGDAVNKAGLNPKVFDQESAQHYRAFASSKDDALRKIISESFSGDPFADNANLYKKLRWDAVNNISKNKGKLAPESISGAIASSLSRERGLGKDEAAHLYKGFLRTEQDLLSKNKAAYNAYNKHISGPLGNIDPRILERLDQIKDKMFNRVGFGSADDTVKRMLSGSDDAIGGLLNVGMHKNYRNAVNNGYRNIYNFGRTALKGKNIARAGILGFGGLTLAGLGMGAKAFGAFPDN